MSGYVLDASVAVTALTEPGSPAAGLLSGNDAAFQVPSIFDAEVLSALRGLVRGGKFDSGAAADLVVDLMVLPVDRWHMSPLLPRMWELRENLTPYDAAYVALAELRKQGGRASCVQCGSAAGHSVREEGRRAWSSVQKCLYEIVSSEASVQEAACILACIMEV
jgi:predicted nucleic acid-binding protein